MKVILEPIPNVKPPTYGLLGEFKFVQFTKKVGQKSGAFKNLRRNMKARGFIHAIGIFLRRKKEVRKQLIESYAQQKVTAMSRRTDKKHEIAKIKEQIRAYQDRKALLMEQMEGLQVQYDQADADEKKMEKVVRQLEGELTQIDETIEEEEGMVDMLTEIEATCEEEHGMLSLVNLSTAKLHETVGVSIIAHLMYMKTNQLRSFAEALVTGGINYRPYVMDNGYTLGLGHRDRYELMTDVAYALELVQTVTDEADALQQEIQASISGAKRGRDDEEDNDNEGEDDNDNEGGNNDNVVPRKRQRSGAPTPQDG